MFTKTSIASGCERIIDALRNLSSFVVYKHSSVCEYTATFGIVCMRRHGGHLDGFKCRFN